MNLTSIRIGVSRAFLTGAGILAFLGVIALCHCFMMLVLACILAGVGVLVSPKGKRRFALYLLLFLIVLSASKFPEARREFDPYRRRGYDAEVKKTLWIAAEAQEAYFKENGTYTTKIGSLKGFDQHSKVNITMETTTTTYVITGTMTEGCSPNTGTWTFIKATGSIDGTPCR